MTDRERAKEAHDKVMQELFRFEKNPTFELHQLTLECLTSKEEVFLMEDYRFIRYAGESWNGGAVYQVRF